MKDPTRYPIANIFELIIPTRNTKKSVIKKHVLNIIFFSTSRGVLKLKKKIDLN